MGPSGVGSGDEEEFATFVRASQRRLRRVAYLVCGDWHRAEDIVQTALAQVYARWSRINREDGPQRYAHRAVVNAAIDDRRRPWRREHAAERLPERGTPDTDGLTLEVVAALSGLPARQRAVVVLRYIEDLDVEATAALLGITTGTVKSQSAKGLAGMRSLLNGATVGAGTGESR
ncbi:MAG: SigE family RNA polymerase sigma factor [Sporichthyaceae bacterium]